MELNKDIRGNPFLNPAIIQHLGSQGINLDDKFTLRNLRQLSTLHHQILNPKYFDTVQLYIIIKTRKSKNKILYGHSSTPIKKLKSLEPEAWDPIIFAPTIRRLILSGNQLNYLFLTKSTRSQMISGFNPMELISQISPYVTTLSLDLRDKRIFQASSNLQLLDFIQQFVNLKKLELQTNKEWITSGLNQFEAFLLKIDKIPKEFGIELALCSFLSNELEFFEIILSPERSFITKNHKLSLNIKLGLIEVGRSREIGAWGRIITLANNKSIPVENFDLLINIYETGEVGRNQMINDLPIISPSVGVLCIWNSFEEMDNFFFTSCKWPRLKKLLLDDPLVNLIGFTTACPNLEELDLTIIESKSIFTNHELTDKENLNQIFGNCTLKILRFKQAGQYYREQTDEIPKIIPGSKLLQYLQKLLPNTSIEAEEFRPGYYESEESSDSSSSYSEGEYNNYI